MLFFGSQVIAVILTVFLHNGNGGAITSTSSNKGAAEEDTILNERTTEREENLADVLGLSELADSQSYEVVQSQYSSDNMIGQYKTRTADYGLRTGYKTRTEV